MRRTGCAAGGTAALNGVYEKCKLQNDERLKETLEEYGRQGLQRTEILSLLQGILVTMHGV